jgi:hypothetical protein
LEPKSKQDFNKLFGYKYDPETQVTISGISPTGKFGRKRGRDKSIASLSFDHRC